MLAENQTIPILGASGTTNNLYDEQGKLIKQNYEGVVFDPAIINSPIFNYQYTPVNSLMTSIGSEAILFEYDAENKLLQAPLNAEQYADYTYSKDGALLETKSYDKTNPTPFESVNLQYDADGKLYQQHIDKPREQSTSIHTMGYYPMGATAYMSIRHQKDGEIAKTNEISYVPNSSGNPLMYQSNGKPGYNLIAEGSVIASSYHDQTGVPQYLVNALNSTGNHISYTSKKDTLLTQETNENGIQIAKKSTGLSGLLMASNGESNAEDSFWNNYWNVIWVSSASGVGASGVLALISYRVYKWKQPFFDTLLFAKPTTSKLNDAMPNSPKKSLVESEYVDVMPNSPKKSLVESEYVDVMPNSPKKSLVKSEYEGEPPNWGSFAEEVKATAEKFHLNLDQTKIDKMKELGWKIHQDRLNGKTKYSTPLKPQSYQLTTEDKSLIGAYKDARVNDELELISSAGQQGDVYHFTHKGREYAVKENKWMPIYFNPEDEAEMWRSFYTKLAKKDSYYQRYTHAFADSEHLVMPYIQPHPTAYLPNSQAQAHLMDQFSLYHNDLAFRNKHDLGNFGNAFFDAELKPVYVDFGMRVRVLKK